MYNLSGLRKVNLAELEMLMEPNPNFNSSNWVGSNCRIVESNVYPYLV